MTTDAVTRRWIRNAADERAAGRGCTFSEQRGEHVLEFARQFVRLYEGDCAGQALVPMDWQHEVTMRLFGWLRPSERWGRPVRRFNAASIWLPKKNGKSPTLAWWGLYLLCADGEPGQKVYFGAKDGGQAREIAGKHAVEMVLSSLELADECTINHTLMQITHEPTRSLLKPISSADSKTQKAKEGLNGSVLVDETHVVDRAFVNRVSRAGISRREPLHIEVSTAGSDPQCYGKERYDYGKRVEAGEVDDDRLFFVAYEAPQDLSDEDLAADPVKWGQRANPAWGHTVSEEEYLADYQRSKVSLSQLAEFKMYRLNVWQQSENPWLNMADWARCQRDVRLDDLAGRPCYAALDLAKTRDTCALALVFPGDTEGTYTLVVFFWLPKRRAEILRDKVSYLEWARAGHLTLTEGDVTDYGFIRKQLAEVKQRFDVRKLAYDDHYASELIQRLVEEDAVYAAEEVVSFPQTVSDFAGPTDQFEGLLREGKLHHDGNPLLTWQAGHTRVKVDVNHNKRPVKQRHGDYRTIDGMVAGIMALQLAMQEPATEPAVLIW